MPGALPSSSIMPAEKTSLRSNIAKTRRPRVRAPAGGQKLHWTGASSLSVPVLTSIIRPCRDLLRTISRQGHATKPNSLVPVPIAEEATMQLVRFAILFPILLLTSHGHSQTVIAGESVFCIDASGVPVVTIFEPNLGDIGMARIEPNGMRTIYLNPIILNSLPRSIQLFWYSHECAHHALGHMLGFSGITREMEADCWAIRLGRDQGWLSPADLNQMYYYFIGNLGSFWGHLPGPQRLQNFVNCYHS